ncbi:hypothetical protein Tco_0032142 [Tanacetum coccineum]
MITGGCLVHKYLKEVDGVLVSYFGWMLVISYRGARVLLEVPNQLHYQDYEWYEALEDCELKEEALRNKAVMEGLMNDDDDDESRYEQRKRWNVYTNYDDVYEINNNDEEREELYEEYVAIREDEYNDSTRGNNDACRAYQEIFRMMDGYKS